ncbi:toxic anion resistance protein [Xenorhabdus sp. KJ12.1]|uniref:toxic anion resistance protein n=1 Tax=Xenorhabdus sp. KJ12.1 TaxID=1851571 RepID=UPI000C03B74C|nr:toxic anion resistance protein [Xenorhabdus sp. KJ12.1]PHM72376.1 tellurite resistance protein [Xenorhabdus sp. KJ12.1]
MQRCADDVEVKILTAELVDGISRANSKILYRFRNAGFFGRLWNSLTGNIDSKLIEFNLYCHRVEKLVKMTPQMLEQIQYSILLIKGLRGLYCKDIAVINQYIEAGTEFLHQYENSNEKQSASCIRLDDAMSVHDFGRQQSGNTHYLDTLLENVKVINQGEAGRKLNEVVEPIRQISESVQPSGFQLAVSKVPIVGPLISQLTIIQRRALSRFDPVKGQIDILTNGIESISTGYLTENVKLDVMYNEVIVDVRQQGINIVASMLAIDTIEVELKRRQDEFKKDKSNTLLAVEINGIEYQLSALKKRHSDMITSQQKSYDDLTMLRMIQQNNLTMIDKFRSIEEMTLPAAKRGHLIVDALEKQNSGVKLTEAIDNTTNALAVRQAELVKENSTRIANAVPPSCL